LKFEKEFIIMKRIQILKILSLVLTFALVLGTIGVSAEELKPKFELTISEDPLDKITDILMEAYKNNDYKVQPAAIWITDIDFDKIEKTIFEKYGFDREFFSLKENQEIGIEVVDKYIYEKRARAVKEYDKNNTTFVSKYLKDFEIGYVSRLAPMIALYLTYEQTLELCKNPNVMLIDWVDDSPIEDDGTVVEELNKVDYNVTNTNPNASQYRGNGIRIGWIETGLPWNYDDTTSNKRYVPVAGLTPNATPHASRTSKVTELMVPNAIIYCAMGQYGTTTNQFQGIENLIVPSTANGGGVHMINQSAGHALITPAYNNFARWLDHLTWHHLVHFIQTIGNAGEDSVRPEGMSINAIVVGAVNEANTGRWISATTGSSSSFVSTSRYSRANNIVAKPDISAPGENFNFRAYTSESNHFNVTDSGTSYAAPIITGTLAKLCQFRPALLTQQEVAKSILTASINSGTTALNNVPGTVNYSRLGAGLVNANHVINFTAHPNRYWGAFTFSPGTNNRRTSTFTIAGWETRCRVSLNFAKRVQFGSGVNHVTGTPTEAPLDDLDIRIYRGTNLIAANLVASSTTSYNNTEIVSFNPQSWGAGTYTIVIDRWGTHDHTTYFGYAVYSR
jgi:hypothetical protein